MAKTKLGCQRKGFLKNFLLLHLKDASRMFSNLILDIAAGIMGCDITSLTSLLQFRRIPELHNAKSRYSYVLTIGAIEVATDSKIENAFNTRMSVNGVEMTVRGRVIDGISNASTGNVH